MTPSLLRALVWLSIALSPALVRAESSAANSGGRRPATVEDSVRLRSFLPDQPVAVSPDWRSLAYALVEPNLERNVNETVLYECELPGPDAGDSKPTRSRALLRTRGIRQLRWLADGQGLLVLRAADDGRGIVERVDRKSGATTPASPAELDVVAFSATRDGRRLAMLVRTPDEAQADRFAAPRGMVITEDDFLLDIDARRNSRSASQLTAVVVADVDGPLATVFAGKRGLGLMQPSISPDGRHLTFLALGEAAPYPAAWQADPMFRSWPEHGFVVPPTELVLAELPNSLPAADRSPSRPDHGANGLPLRLALDAGCIADYLWDLPTAWSDDGSSFLACGPSGVGEPGAIDEPLVGPYRPQRMFEVDARSGAARRVLDDAPGQMLAFDGPSGRAKVILRSGELATLRRSGATGGAWKIAERQKLPAARLDGLTMAAADGGRFVGVRQTVTTPPDLALLDVATGRLATLTEINPELREQTLGRVETIRWPAANGSKVEGYLIYPVDYAQGQRYPGVILCKSWDEGFIHGGNDGLIGNFAPQALANLGFVVLMMQDAVGPYPRGTWKGLPGGISEAFRAMDAFETALRQLDRLGLVDPARVGLMGFSRSSWNVDFTITHSHEKWGAAVSADSGIYNYGTYLGDKNLRSGMAAMYGGPPSGDTFKAWLDYAPPFSASKTRTPLLMQYHGKVSMAAEFYSALVTQGKPVELVLFPEGKHILDLPQERTGSMQGSVDWFRFWLQGYENPSPQYAGQNERWRALRAQHERNEKLLAEGKDPAVEFVKRKRPAKPGE